MARPYPNFGNVKTLTLPIPSLDNFSIAQYKEKYGIDLKDILIVESDGDMHLKYNGLILLSDIENGLGDGFNTYGEYSTFAISAYHFIRYEFENTDGMLDIGFLNLDDKIITGLRFMLPKESKPSYDSVIIKPIGS